MACNLSRTIPFELACPLSARAFDEHGAPEFQSLRNPVLQHALDRWWLPPVEIERLCIKLTHIDDERVGAKKEAEEDEYEDEEEEEEDEEDEEDNSGAVSRLVDMVFAASYAERALRE